MHRFTSDTLDARLVEATTSGGPTRLPTVVSLDELEAIATPSPGETGPKATEKTEPCAHTCGGCRG